MNKQLYMEDLRAALTGTPDLSDLSGKRILVTGASGLLGKALVDLIMLANEQTHLGAEVVAMSRHEAALRERFDVWALSPLLSFATFDVDAKLEGRYDYIVHAASPAHPMAFALDPVGTMQANLRGAETMLESLRAAGNGRLLMVSSGEIYGEMREDTRDFKETDMGYIDSMNPRSCYPESKRAAETLCASYKKQHGVDVVVARPCHCYGPMITSENSRADAQFLRNALEGQDIVMKSAGSQVRSYLYATDAAAGLLWVLLRGASGEAYNIANPDSVMSIREYAELVAKVAGVNVRFELPSGVELSGYGTIPRATLDERKIHQLGFRARMTAEEGIARMIAIAR